MKYKTDEFTHGSSWCLEEVGGSTPNSGGGRSPPAEKRGSAAIAAALVLKILVAARSHSATGFGEVELCRPGHEQDRSLPAAVRLRLVEVREVAAPRDVEPLHWRLLTTHEIADSAKAWQIVEWYQARWVIEQLFRLMKSQGLQLKDCQLASADRLVKLTALATKAACIDIQLTQERDGKHQLPAAAVLPSRKSIPSKRLLRPLKATPSGRRTRIPSTAWPERPG
ncbi:MAG: transposase [Acetobacteraceae bacterium]|nr:transposase [Acetobacteraceae bacterium]